MKYCNWNKAFDNYDTKEPSILNIMTIFGIWEGIRYIYIFIYLYLYRNIKDIILPASVIITEGKT